MNVEIQFQSDDDAALIENDDDGRVSVAERLAVEKSTRLIEIFGDYEKLDRPDLTDRDSTFGRLVMISLYPETDICHT